MIAAPPFGDIVEQDRDVQRAAVGDFVDDIRRERMVAFKITPFDPRHQSDRTNGMLIDRVVMIHIKLHLRVDPAKIGNEPSEHRGLVQPAQHCLRIVAAGQQIKEQRIGARISAQPVSQPGIAQRQTHRLRMDFQPIGIGQHEQFEQPHWIAGEPIVRRHVDFAAEHLEPFEAALARAKSGKQPARLLAGELFVKLGEKQPGQVADVFGLQKEVLHEPFDCAFARTIGELHPRGNLALQIEGQPVLGAAGNGVEVAAHRPKEVLSPAEVAVFLAGQQPGADQFGNVADVVDIFADPVQRVQIAQSAFALLNVGFDHVAAIAQPLVTFVALGQFLRDILPLGSGDHFGPEPRAGRIEQRLIAPHIAPFEQCGADCQIAFGHPHHIVERAAGMPDLERQIPQVIEHRLDHLFAPGGLFTRGDEGNIDVRMRRHFAAPIAAHRHDRQPLARGAVVRGVDIGDDVIVDYPDQLIDQECLRLGAVMPGGGMRAQPGGNLGPAIGQGSAQQRDHARPGFGRPGIGHRIGNRPGQRAPIDHRALIVDPPRAHALAVCSLSHRPK